MPFIPLSRSHRLTHAVRSVLSWADAHRQSSNQFERNLLGTSTHAHNGGHWTHRKLLCAGQNEIKIKEKGNDTRTNVPVTENDE